MLLYLTAIKRLFMLMNFQLFILKPCLWTYLCKPCIFKLQTNQGKDADVYLRFRD